MPTPDASPEVWLLPGVRCAGLSSVGLLVWGGVRAGVTVTVAARARVGDTWYRSGPENAPFFVVILELRQCYWYFIYVPPFKTRVADTKTGNLVRSFNTLEGALSVQGF